MTWSLISAFFEEKFGVNCLRPGAAADVVVDGPFD